MAGESARVVRGMFVDGQYVSAASGKTLPVVNPKNGEVFADVADGNASDIDIAVAAAERAFPKWSALSGTERGDILHRASEILRRRLPEIITMEVDQIGRPRREMAAQLARLPEWYSYFASVARTYEDRIPPFGKDHLNYTRRIPLGVVGHLRLGIIRF